MFSETNIRARARPGNLCAIEEKKIHRILPARKFSRKKESLYEARRIKSTCWVPVFFLAREFARV